MSEQFSKYFQQFYNINVTYQLEELKQLIHATFSDGYQAMGELNLEMSYVQRKMQAATEYAEALDLIYQELSNALASSYEYQDAEYPKIKSKFESLPSLFEILGRVPIDPTPSSPEERP